MCVCGRVYGYHTHAHTDTPLRMRATDLINLASRDVNKRIYYVTHKYC